MLAVSRRALPLSHSCRNRSESLRETHGELIPKTRHLFEGNDTSGPRQICGFRKQNVSKAGFCFFFLCFSVRKKTNGSSGKCSKTPKQQRLWSERNCITTRSCRYSFWVCSGRVCTRSKDGEGDRYKHSWVLAQSLGQGVMTEAGRMREDFQRVVQGVVL